MALRHSPSKRGKSGVRRSVGDEIEATPRTTKEPAVAQASARRRDEVQPDTARPAEPFDSTVVTPRDVVPLIRGNTRRSYNRQDTQEKLLQNNRPKEKRAERLWMASARPDANGSAAQAPHASPEEEIVSAD
ncbi:unnamed protein product, partial [Mesorhabditis spiculigera]